MTSDKTRSKIRVRALVLAQALILVASLGVPMAALAVDGDGTVTVSPTTVVSGSTGNTLTFVHTLASSWTTGQNVVRLQITVPGGGWSAPRLAAGAGRVAISAETCPGAPTIGVSGSNIQISGTNSNCQAGNTVTVTYAATAGSTLGANTFTSYTRTAGNAGALTAIAASPVVTVTAPKVNTTTAITSHSPDPSVAGSAISVGVSVTRASGSLTPGGTVTISDGTVTSAPCALSGSGATATATCSLSPSTAGVKTLTATYGGDAAFNGSSGTASHTVNKADSTTTITSDAPDPSIVGAAVSVGVSVTRASGSLTPGGTVTISDGTVTSAPCALSGSGATATATCSLSPSTAGVKTLTATYGGDAAFNGSSGTASHTVTGADGSGTVAIHWDSVGNYAYADPTVTPGMSLELIDFNFTATAPMAAGSQVTIVVPAGWTPPTIADSAGVLAINPTTPALTTPTCALPTAGTPQMAVSGSGPWTITIDVTCAAGSTFRVRWGNTLANVITAPAAGTYVFTTQSKGPGGTLTNIPAPQPTITVVKQNQAALSITGPATKSYGDAPFSPTTSGGSGTGAVTFTSSTPLVCTASGSATVTIVGAGTCTVTATKAADANYNSATSAPYSITVNKINQAALVVTGTSSPAGYGSTQTLGTTGGSGTGAVTYSTGASTACSVVGNVLTITASTGTCTVTATKAADANYNATTSAAVSVTVARGVLVVTPDAQSRTFGQTAPTYTFSVTGFRTGENAGNAAGYVAPTCTSAYTPATPVTSSPLTITCSGGSATNYTFDTTATALLTITKQNQAALSITGPATKSYGDAPFSPTTSGGSGTGAVTFTSSTPLVCTASGSATVTIVGAGTCTVTATKAADANYNSATSAPFSIEIDPATSTTTVTCPASVVYNGSAQEPCTVTVTGAGGLSLTPDPVYADNTDAGTASASYIYAGDANHGGSSDSATFEIDPATSTTTVTCPASVVYNGSAQEPCTVTVTGAGGLSLTPDPVYADNTDAGTASASYIYAGDANHGGSSDSATFEIDPATSTTTVTCPASVVYNGSAQEPCTVTVTGAGGLSLTPDPVYADNTDAGTASASYIYAGDANHGGSSDSATFEIDPATSTTTVTCPASVVYNGSAQEPCTVTVTGAGGLSLTPDPVYADNTDAGTASASYIYAGDANHGGSSDSATFEIDPATSTTTVTCPASVVYNGSAQEPCTVTVTGAGGLSLTPDPVYADNTDAGTASASYIYAGDANHGGSSDSATFEIDPATSTTTVTCPASVVYNGSAQEPCTVTVTGAGGLSLTPDPVYADNTDAGTASASYSYAGDANHGGSSDSATFEIDPATSTTTVTCPASVVYNGSAQEPCTVTVTGAGGLSLTPDPVYADNTDAGTASASYSYAGDANHGGSSDSATFEIDPATSTTTVTCPASVVYNGSAQEPCTVTVTGAGGLSLTPDPVYADNTDAGTASASYSYAGDANHGGSSDSATFEIDPATSTTTVTCPASVVYNGSAQEPCTVTVTGAGGLSLTPDPVYADNTDAGTASASYSYAGDANHAASSDSATFEIDPATSTTTVTCPASVVYNGSAQEPCTVTVTGAGGLSLTPDPVYADNTDAGTASASYSYAGDANHGGSSDSATFEIDPATSTTTVTCPASVVYNGSAQEPCTVTVTGAGGLSLTPDPVYADNTDAGTASASYSYAGDANHAASSDSATFEIDPADPDCTVTGYAGTYDGVAHGATGSCLGVDGTTVLVGLDLGASFTDVPGGTADWTFTDTTGNYNDASGSIAITIARAATVTVLTCAAGPFTYTGSAKTPCTASVTGPGGLDQVLTIGYFDNTNAGTATATASYAGDTNYAPSTDSATFDIGKVQADCSVTGWTGTYDGEAHGATGTCTGVGGTSLAGLDLGASFRDVPGGAADWLFANRNYFADSGSVDIDISAATQAINFPPMPNVKMGATGFVLGATTDSGLPVTYTSLTPDVCTVSGTTVTIVGVGTCSIEASQAGDANHGPAQTVTQSFRVLPAESSTPETSTASPFAILGGSGSIPPGLLLVVLAAGILAGVLMLLGLRARRDDMLRGDIER